MHIRLATDLLLRSWLALGVAVFVAGAIHDSGFLLELEASPNERVAWTGFGVESCEGFVETSDVDLIAGETFSWRLLVPDGQPVAWREELVLPSAPAQWSGAHFIEIKDGGRTAVTAGVDLPYEGLIGHGWSITDGDPPGDYELRLWVDGQLHHVFHFNVE